MIPGAILIADYIIGKSNRPLTPMEVIKLAYISHGFTLALTDKKLFNDKVEAWRYGPVIPNIYHEFKHYGGNEITRLKTCGTSISNVEQIQDRLNTFRQLITADGVNIIDRVLEVYGNFSALGLSTITHEECTPWDECYHAGKLGVEIPSNLTKQYYAGQLK